MICGHIRLAFAVATLCAAASSFSTPSAMNRRTALSAEKPFFSFPNLGEMLGNGAATDTQNKPQEQQSRVLGSQELLMLPRQYGVKPDNVFPSMNHISCALLSATPSEKHLKQAIDAVIQAHPMLSAQVQGTGEPEKRIDLFKMVRQGEPSPLSFVSGQPFKASDILQVIATDDDPELFEDTWKDAFLQDLDDGSWCNTSDGPLWRLQLVSTGKANSPCALIFSFNHAISDQSSASRLTDQLLSIVAELEQKGRIQATRPLPQDMPLSVEESVLGRNKTWSDVQAGDVSPRTLTYVAGKAAEDAQGPVVMPDGFSNGGGIVGALTTISGNAAGGDDGSSKSRKSILEFRSLSVDATTALLEQCRANGVSITNALSAAATLVSSDFVDNGTASNKERVYKVLQSLDMRRFGEQLDDGKSVGCLAGSMDLMHGPLPDKSGQALRENPTDRRISKFWQLAKDGRSQTADFIETDGPKQAVRVFDFAMTIADLNNLVDLTAQSKDSQGRAYTAGFANAGVFERIAPFEQETARDGLSTTHGRYEIQDIYYAASNARSGSLYRFSCMSVGGEIKFTFHPAAPILTEEVNTEFANALVETLEIVAGVKEVEVKDEFVNPLELLPENALASAVAAVGSVALLSHAGAFADFFGTILQMKQNIEDPADFWAALNFWIFFAVGHPILQPILWISDVLHGSPGPKIADLVPYTFLAGNIVAIAAFSFSKEIQKAANIGLLFAFLTYVGAGLDGTAGLGDFNLALDDPYKGQIVKGCPTYEEVRQPSMDNFDLEKYQGLWYEHKFHDWTQFKEVYDTTLGIKLTPDKQGWIDDFAVKGPAPDSAPLSWDKSPVGNGAHYFLFGRVDPNEAPGVLRESGFGVEFPNYIVDIQRDPKTGEYKEAIQFQCLERGGVRVFEGINFMSKNPTMSSEEMTAMHARAEKAGMYPYGASPEQMHTVARRPIDAPPLDNAWQSMWHAIGVDSLLELLTEAIEDGGR